MNNFNIEVIGKKPQIKNKIKVFKGRITIDDFDETFYISLDMWNVNEYQQQWKEGLERIKTENSSCLVVDYAGPKENPWIQLWTLYKEKDVVFIHNQYLFYEIFEERSKGLPPFDAKSCYLYIILPRRTVTEDGTKISEWKTDMNAINEFLEKQYYQSQA